MIVINLFGAPSSGKSTCASLVFTALKMKRASVELVTEFAKEKTWEQNELAINNQAYIFGCQSYRQSRLLGKVDIIITDSPLPLSILYNTDERLGEEFNTVVMKTFSSYDNVNYYLDRKTEYDANGRWQTEEEADKLAKKLENLLADRKIVFQRMDGNEEGYKKIIECVLNICEAKGYI